MEIGSIHIWLIDDDEIQNFINEKVIQRVIPSASIAKYLSAQSAIDDLRTDKVKPDIILLDINMPIMTGWDFMKLLEKDRLYTHNDKNISVYILSSSKDPSDIEKMGEYPTLKGFFHKPLNLGYLQNLIDDLKQ